MEIGRRLRELRRSRGMSLQEVGARVGLHFSTIGKYERGERRPGVDVLRELSQVYGVPLAELLEAPSDDFSLAAALRVLSERADLRELALAARHLSDAQLAALVHLIRCLLPAPEAEDTGGKPEIRYRPTGRG